jgi:hypothetical protein
MQPCHHRSYVSISPWSVGSRKICRNHQGLPRPIHLSTIPEMPEIHGGEWLCLLLAVSSMGRRAAPFGVAEVFLSPPSSVILESTTLTRSPVVFSRSRARPGFPGGTP